MKKIAFSAAIAAAALCLGGCHDDSIDWGGGQQAPETGTLNMASLGVSVDFTEQTRAAADVNSFLVHITDAAAGTLTKSGVYGDMAGQSITLPVGNYRIEAKSHEVGNAEWSKPYYHGDKTFTILKDQTTTLSENIVCSFKNIRVTVDFEEPLKEVMGDDCKVKISIGDGTLTYTAATAEDGYFKAYDQVDKQYLIAEFTGTVQGKPLSTTRTFNDVVAGQHHTLTYKLVNPGDPDHTGDGQFSITVDDSFTTVEGGGNIDTGEEEITPGPDQPGGEGTVIGLEGYDEIPADPIVVTTNADASNPVADKVIKLKIDVPGKIEKLQVTINSEILDAFVSDPALDLKSFDMAHPNETQKTNLQSFGFLQPGQENVYGLTEAGFEISAQFLALMAVLGEGDHEFVIEVTDQNGATKDATLKLHVK